MATLRVTRFPLPLLPIAGIRKLSLSIDLYFRAVYVNGWSDITYGALLKGLQNKTAVVLSEGLCQRKIPIEPPTSWLIGQCPTNCATALNIMYFP